MASRATEKVEHLDRFEIDAIVQNVEEGLFGKIGGGPGWPFISRWVEPAPFEFSAYDPQNSSG